MSSNKGRQGNKVLKRVCQSQLITRISYKIKIIFITELFAVAMETTYVAINIVMKLLKLSIK